MKVDYSREQGCFVDVVPKGKERPRVVRVNGRTRAYTPTSTKNYEKAVALAYKKAGGAYFTEPVAVYIKGFFPIPTSWSAKKKKAAENGDIIPTVKPDLDNLAKAVLDGLNGVAFADDKQVVALSVYKCYSIVPFVSISVAPYENK